MTRITLMVLTDVTHPKSDQYCLGSCLQGWNMHSSLTIRRKDQMLNALQLPLLWTRMAWATDHTVEEFASDQD